MTPIHRTTMSRENGRVTALDNGLKLITKTPYQLSAVRRPGFMAVARSS